MTQPRKLFPSLRITKDLSNKRKVKSYLKKVLGLFFLFCVTLSSLFLFKHVHQPKTIFLSPLSNFVQVVGNDTSPNVQNIQNLCQKYSLHCEHIEIGLDNNAIITLDSGVIAVISFSKDIDKQIASLQLTQSRLTIEGKKLSKIDFRFDRPVVSF